MESGTIEVTLYTEDGLAQTVRWVLLRGAQVIATGTLPVRDDIDEQLRKAEVFARSSARDHALAHDIPIAWWKSHAGTRSSFPAPM